MCIEILFQLTIILLIGTRIVIWYFRINCFEKLQTFEAPLSFTGPRITTENAMQWGWARVRRIDVLFEFD